MKVSIIIPTYNEEKVIGNCLQSLAEQSFEDLEIIVVDDGSTDNTQKIVQSLKFPASKFHFLKQKHLGAGAARNLGAKHAKGFVLVFVDADMTFDKDFIKKLVAPILEDKAIGTFSKEEYLSNKNNIWARCWNINRNSPLNQMHPKTYADSQKVFRAILKDEFENAGGFDEKAGYTDDWTLSEKLGVLAKNVSGAIFYHKNPGSLGEVFTQSRWTAKRKYKLGIIGVLITLFRVSFPFSFLVGIYKSFTYFTPQFLIFKLVYDFASFLGIIEFSFLSKPLK